MWRPMKPETIARRAQERQQEQAERTSDLHARLTAKAKQEPDSIFPDLLAEFEKSHPEYQR